MVVEEEDNRRNRFLRRCGGCGDEEQDNLLVVESLLSLSLRKDMVQGIGEGESSYPFFTMTLENTII